MPFRPGVKRGWFFKAVVSVHPKDPARRLLLIRFTERGGLIRDCGDRGHAHLRPGGRELRENASADLSLAPEVL